jgi:hypothetical protein
MPDRHGRERRGRQRIDRLVDDMRGHAQGQVGQRAEGGEIDRLQVLQRGRDTWQVFVAVHHAKAIARQVLQDRHDAPRHQPVGHRARDLGHRIGVPPV